MVAVIVAGLTAELLPIAEAAAAPSVGAIEAQLTAPASVGATDTPLAAPKPVATSGTSTFGQWWTNADGSRTQRLFTEPVFQRSNGEWAPIDTTVREGAGAAALAVEEAALPTRFFADSDRLVELSTAKGPLTLSAPDLSIGEPKLVDGAVEYRNVAKDTDLRYRVLADSVKEEIVLRSAASPLSYDFHLADPDGVLGRASQQADGSWQFDGELGPDLRLMIPPAVAYEDEGPTVPPLLDPKSASLDLRTVAGGFDMTIRVDERWLAGKSFPVVLDPTLDLTGASGTAIDGTATSGSTGNYLMNSTTPCGQLDGVDLRRD